MQPVLVRPLPGGDYELIAGERRWRAAQIAKLDSIPAIVRRVEDEIAVAMALIENIQREDPAPGLQGGFPGRDPGGDRAMESRVRSIEPIDSWKFG